MENTEVIFMTIIIYFVGESLVFGLDCVIILTQTIFNVTERFIPN